MFSSSNLAQRDVESSTPEIEYEHLFLTGATGFVVETISNGGRSWLIDYLPDIETGDDSGVYGGLSLRIVEVGRNNYNNVFLWWCQDDRLVNVFWADAYSRELYKEFGNVVTFDTTYLVNKYNMPFAPFVGVNHHGQSILFGCGLILREDTPSFVWLFETWLSCMSDSYPNAIITDQCRAMQNAISEVFPNARHRWCLWHIMKKIRDKLKSYNEYKAIKTSLKSAVYDSLYPVDFEQNWADLIKQFNLQSNDWLAGLYKERHRWVPAFVKDTFWAGMSTTQRSESMNAFFDGYVHSNTTLKEFVGQYENALRKKVQKEEEADAHSLNFQIQKMSPYGFEDQFLQVYTIGKCKEFREQVAQTIG
ncbi:hypothetical protein RHMOL_Rhmol13G0103200 [Rhododendron molle]|uniref:Uncharacterized protein n=1 Tax=Rhododendron molle TaxID=49168 RepID=A0ACC0L6E8_RHOML|nr:hypothetical protein RHMOL_Rhmol13G0103200 [Rhododendron molle]